MRPDRTASSFTLALLAATFLTPPERALAAPGDARGGEFQVNTFVTESQSRPAVAMDADGDFVVAWESYGQDGFDRGIIAQRFDAAGTAQGPEFQVNTFTTGNQWFAAVAMDADGDFVVAWMSFGQDGSGTGIFARRFDATGAAQGGEFQVNSFTTSDQSGPAVAMDAEGDFVVAWTDYYGQDGSSWGVFARRYDAAGTAQGPEFQVNTFTTSFQGDPAVAMDADGDFVVAWTDYADQDGNGYGVFAQRFDAAGAVQGLEFQVNTFTTGDQIKPVVAMDADGDFVVAWESSGQDGSGYGVFARRFDAAGAAQGLEVQVNSFTTGTQGDANVAMDADGDFVVAWQSYLQDGSYYGIFAQRYDAAGLTQGPEVQVNTFTTNFQADPAVAMDADGDFVVAWESFGQDGSSLSVFAQRFDGVERIEGDFDGDGNADILWHNAGTGTAIVWLMDGETRLAAQSIGAPPPVWQVAGTGDFNGDGKADIAWRHTGNGSTVVWQMDGFSKVAGASIGKPPLVWEIEQVRDTNGDGLSDVLWRNTTTGATIVWLMNGFTRVLAGPTGAVPDVWQVSRAPAGTAPGDALGPEFQVNSFTTGTQGDANVAMDADGDFVVAWHSNGQDGNSWGVFARRYNAAGRPEGGVFQVNQETASHQTFPSVAVDADGDFVVAWGSNGQDGSGYGIFARRYDAAGVAQGPEFQVNTFTTNHQSGATVAMDAEGDFVVAWQSDGQDGSGRGVYARRYDAAGNALDPTGIPVNSHTTNDQSSPVVAMDADGDFVVAWQTNGQDGSGDGIFARRFDAAGAAQGDEVQINAFTTNQQRAPAVAVDAEGDFVVAWHDSVQDGSSWGVYVRRYDAAGNALDPAGIPVNSHTASHQTYPAVALDAEGDFVVTWGSNLQDGSGYGIFAQRYDGAGAAQGLEVQVSSFTASNQARPTVAMDADGDFVVAWHSNGQDGSGDGVFAQRFDGVARVAGDSDGDGNADILWHNTSTGSAVVWLMDGTTKLAAQSIGKPPVVWQVAGTGDFNGDGKADIAWRNTGSGATVVWQMDGFTRVAAASIGKPPLVWEIEQIRDANGDGLSDVLWRNATTGNSIVWLMNGFTRVRAGSIGSVPDVWQVH